MIKNHELSEKLILNAGEADKLIHESLFWVRDACSQQEFEDYRRSVAHVMALIFEKIVVPLSKEHPDLDPLKKYNEETAGPKEREDNIPAYDKHAPPMLERLYHIEKPNGTKSGMNIHLRKPAKSEDGDDWYCTWQISSDFGHLSKKAFGVDAMDAFNSALVTINERVSHMVGNNNITWKGGEGLCLPVK